MNEFIIKNGLIVNGGTSTISGSLGVTGSVSVRSVGALSTDIAFRVRNSADSKNLVEALGNGNLIVRNNSLNTQLSIVAHPFEAGHVALSNSADPFYDTGTAVTMYDNALNFRLKGGINFLFTGIGPAPYSKWGFKVQQTPARLFLGIDLEQSFQFQRYNFGIGNFESFGTNATQTLGILNGIAPTTSPADMFQQYSADIVAGNAAPHFRTEAGNIVKLYTQPAVTSSQGIADALTNLGFLTGSSVIPNSIPTHDGPTYDTNAIQTVTAAEYAALTPNASTIYFIV